MNCFANAQTLTPAHPINELQRGCDGRTQNMILQVRHATRRDVLYFVAGTVLAAMVRGIEIINVGIKKGTSGKWIGTVKCALRCTKGNIPADTQAARNAIFFDMVSRHASKCAGNDLLRYEEDSFDCRRTMTVALGTYTLHATKPDGDRLLQYLGEKDDATEMGISGLLWSHMDCVAEALVQDERELLKTIVKALKQKKCTESICQLANTSTTSLLDADFLPATHFTCYYGKVFDTSTLSREEKAYMAAVGYVVGRDCGIQFSAPSLYQPSELMRTATHFRNVPIASYSEADSWGHDFGLGMLTVIQGMAMASHLQARAACEDKELGEIEETEALLSDDWAEVVNRSTMNQETFTEFLQDFAHGCFKLGTYPMGSDTRFEIIQPHAEAMRLYVSTRALTMILAYRLAIQEIAQALIENKALTRETADRILDEAEQF